MTINKETINMARGVNKAILVGNLGNDPEMHYTGDGRAICNISIATSESWKDKQTGEKVEKTEWHRCNAFGPLAEVIGKYLKKGSLVYVEGQIVTRQYEKDGTTRYSTEVKIRDMQMLGGTHGAGTEQRQEGGFRAETPPAQAQANPAAPAQAAAPAPAADGFDQDDIPF